MSRLAPLALAAAFRGLASTWRFEVVGDEHHDLAAHGPFVYALWHHALLPLLWWHRHREITLLVSRHRDGDLVAGPAERLGYRLARGSSTRGGASGFRTLLRDLAKGRVVAVTPDGPTGPARRVKPGVLRAAAVAGVPILPVSAVATRAWYLRTWDRLLVPKPFASVCVRYGTPVWPDRGDDAALGRAVAGALDALGERQEAIA
jgi:lysophospholipid acyltransferase (LPLAT)-like uncharacterized protein